MELTAKIKKIYPLEEKQVGDKVYKSQTFTVVVPHKDNPKYDKHPSFIVKNDKALEALSYYREGNTVTVTFEMDSREWNGKVYGENIAWKLAGDPLNQVNEPKPQVADNQTDDLPF